MGKIINFHDKKLPSSKSQDQIVDDLISLLSDALIGDKRRTQIVEEPKKKNLDSKANNVTNINKYRK